MRKTFFTILVVAILSPQSVRAQSVFFLTDSLGWVAYAEDGTHNGGLYRTTNAGASWSHVAVDDNVSDIQFANPRCGFAMVQPSWGGGNRVVGRSTDGGQNWSPCSMPPALYGYEGLSVRDSLTSFVWADGQRLLYRTTDGGLSWDSTFIDSAAYPTSKIFFKDAMTGWICSSGTSWYMNGISKTIDGGTSWKTVHKDTLRFSEVTGLKGSDTVYGIRLENEVIRYASCRVCKSTDGGASWIDLFVQYRLGQLVLATPQIGWIFSWSPSPGDNLARILRTTDGGVNWSTEYSWYMWPGYLSLCSTPNGGAWAIAGEQLLHRSPTVARWDTVDVTVDNSGDQSPKEYALLQNFPNPFNSSTTIRYGLPQPAHVTLTVFNIIGQKVAELVNGEVEAGNHTVQFSATGLASGLYLYRISAGGFVETKKLVLLK